MADPKTPHDEAFRRLDKRLDDLATSTRRNPSRFAEQGTSAGYRVIGELLGGILGGLGLGSVLDHVAGTTPWGLISGVLIGTGASIFLVFRSATRMSKTKETETAPAPVDVSDPENGSV
ncbi:MAG: AtpZ/AtpI family protein [Caulobacteraceae bacterium]